MPKKILLRKKLKILVSKFKKKHNLNSNKINKHWLEIWKIFFFSSIRQLLNELEYKYKLETTYSAHYLYIICRKMESYIEEGVRRRLPGLNKRDSSPRFVWLILTGLSPDIRELNCVSRYLDCVNVSSVALLTYQRLTYLH